MVERKEFFETKIDFKVLEEHAHSDDSTLRWAASIELGQIGTVEAIALLGNLINDPDENVRDASDLALKQCDPLLVGKTLSEKWSQQNSEQEYISGEIAPYQPWKVRPLEEPSKQTEWIVDASVLNIVQTEAPMTGSRLLRLYGNAVYPNNPRKLAKSKIQSSLKRLEGRRLIEIGNSESSVEFWLITNKGKSPVLIREKGPRKLSEIPVTEVIANLQIELGDEYENLSTDSRFNTLISIYGIKQAEFHILGEVLTNEWQELLS